MKHGSLFSGIGGFDLAAEWAGWENVFHCEWNEFGQQVLKNYWPKAITYNDITQTDFTIHRGQIDILTGGFPCQPYSAAGKRLGKEDDRHLWPEMLRAIREIQPRWVVGENVYGLVNWNGGMVFEEVQADLEAEGYEVQPFILPACAKGAPHRRDRVWFLAYSVNCGHKTRRRKTQEKNGIQGKCRKKMESRQLNGANISREYGTNTNTSSKRLSRSENEGGIEEIRENTYEQPARLLQPTWENFPTQSPVCGRNDGIPSELVGITVPKHRKESIKAYGNAVVPQVVYEIFKSINKYEQIWKQK